MAKCQGKKYILRMIEDVEKVCMQVCKYNYAYVCLYVYMCKVILKTRNDLKFGIGMPVCSYSTFASLSKIDDEGNESSVYFVLKQSFSFTDFIGRIT